MGIAAIAAALSLFTIANAKREDNTGSGLGFKEESTSSSCSGLEGTEADNGYDQGYVDAHRHFVGKSGHANAPDDILKNGSDEFKSGYKKGYSDGLDDAQKGIQDPKCW